MAAEVAEDFAMGLTEGAVAVVGKQYAVAEPEEVGLEVVDFATGFLLTGVAAEVVLVGSKLDSAVADACSPRPDAGGSMDREGSMEFQLVATDLASCRLAVVPV